MPWEQLFSGPVGAAFDAFLGRVRYQPRDSGWVSYVPAKVGGLTKKWRATEVDLSWADHPFAELPSFGWSSWPAFATYEVWGGATADFTTATGTKLVAPWSNFCTLALGDLTVRFVKVAAVSTTGLRGPLSDPVGVSQSHPRRHLR
jgi:hypothetical protein